MESNNLSQFQNVMPHFIHVVNRICSPAWKINEQLMDKHNLMLIYDGEAVISCNGKEYRASEGNLIYFKPGDIRFARTNPNNLMKCYAVDFSYICPIFADNEWTFDLPQLPFRTIETIQDNYLFSRLINLFDELTRIWLSGSEKKVIRSRAAFIEILYLLLEWKTGSNINYDKIRKVEKVVNFMAHNYNKKLTLQQLAEYVDLSPSYLSSVFKDVNGKSPIEYLIEIRINRAKELIKDGHNISETASRVGFNDIYYFSKYFKRIQGVSPTEWFKRQKQ